MELVQEIYGKLGAIEWFERCGSPSILHLELEAVPAVSLREALSAIESPNWQDARTEAQGDLTAYISKTRSHLYGGHWNRLAKESRQIMQTRIMPAVNYALQQLDATRISDSVLLDLNRIALHAAYRKQCPRLPRFFEDLFAVYANGQLPCGWQGNMNAWPTGRLVVY